MQCHQLYPYPTHPHPRFAVRHMASDWIIRFAEICSRTLKAKRTLHFHRDLHQVDTSSEDETTTEHRIMFLLADLARRWMYHHLTMCGLRDH